MGAHDEWQGTAKRRYLSEASMTLLSTSTTEDVADPLGRDEWVLGGPGRSLFDGRDLGRPGIPGCQALLS